MMLNQYEAKTNTQLVKILRSRSLPIKGRKPELVQRLLDADEAHAARTNQLDQGPSQNDGRPTVPDLPDFYSILPHIYLFYDSSMRIRGTLNHIRDALEGDTIPSSLVDVQSGGYFALLWRKIAHGRKLPALVKRGRVIGDFEQIKEWLESGNLKARFDEACENAQVNLPEPEYVDVGESLEDVPIIPGLGPNPCGFVIPPWANLPPQVYP